MKQPSWDRLLNYGITEISLREYIVEHDLDTRDQAGRNGYRDHINIIATTAMRELRIAPDIDDIVALEEDIRFALWHLITNWSPGKRVVCPHCRKEWVSTRRFEPNTCECGYVLGLNPTRVKESSQSVSLTSYDYLITVRDSNNRLITRTNVSLPENIFSYDPESVVAMIQRSLREQLESIHVDSYGTRLDCVVCGYSWIKLRSSLPIYCPNPSCKSKDWNNDAVWLKELP